MAVWTNTGIILVARALQSAGQQVNITYVGLSSGCGLLGAPITGGVPITSIQLGGTLPVTLSGGQSLTITDGVHSDVCATSGGVTSGVTSIPVNSFTPAHSYAITVTGICPTPVVTDGALYNESVRVPANPGAAGGTPGESLTNGYFDGTQATNLYLMVGYFGGTAATAATGTGILMVEDVQYWLHVLNSDSNSYQADTTI